MANANRPMGLRPLYYQGGAAYTGQVTRYVVLAGDGTALFMGDPVKLVGTGDANGVASITRCTANADVPVGVVVGFVPDKNYEAQTYRTGSTLRYVLVADDPNLVFEVQANGTFGYATAPGQNVGMTYTAGSTSTGLSNVVADLASLGTSSALPLKVLGAKPGPDNDSTDTSNVRLLVTIQNHMFKPGVTGV